MNNTYNDERNQILNEFVKHYNIKNEKQKNDENTNRNNISDYNLNKLSKYDMELTNLYDEYHLNVKEIQNNIKSKINTMQYQTKQLQFDCSKIRDKYIPDFDSSKMRDSSDKKENDKSIMPNTRNIPAGISSANYFPYRNHLSPKPAKRMFFYTT